MSPSEPPDVHKLLKKHQIKPNKRLGQNFLTDQNSLQVIVQIAQIDHLDNVLEIGSGLGNLTFMLASCTKEVTAVEIDPNLIPILKSIFVDAGNVHIIHGDILNMRISEIIQGPEYVVVANIPYYITSALFRHLLEAENRPARMILTVQYEVAKRICAQPGDMSLLALSVQVYGSPEIKAKAPATAFYPQPEVDSAVVRVDLFDTLPIESGQLDLFFRLAKAGFSQKRKTMRNAISAGMAWSKENTAEYLTQAGIDPQRRAQTLSLTEWITLTG
ncbi:MAG: ribosomal RNA small subunit methyltransferase A, partial [Anaerolineales bacterium]|nr:ribosomal RNA small subunit methyltransferase A [Anaerolineales bacterium]